MKERRSKKRNKPQLLLKSILVIARLTVPSGWSVSLDGEAFNFAFKATGLPDLHFDPYLVREKFFEIKTKRAARSFLKTFGPLDVQSGQPGIDVPPGGAGTAPRLTFAHLLELQSFYKKVLTEPKYWAKTCNFAEPESSGFSGNGFRTYARLNLLRSPNFTIGLGRSQFFLSDSAFVLQAIYATIYLDWLSGLKSVNCPMCHKIVRQKNQHFRRFCSTRCGNLSRKENLKAKEKSHAKA